MSCISCIIPHELLSRTESLGSWASLSGCSWKSQLSYSHQTPRSTSGEAGERSLAMGSPEFSCSFCIISLAQEVLSVSTRKHSFLSGVNSRRGCIVGMDQALPTINRTPGLENAKIFMFWVIFVSGMHRDSFLLGDEKLAVITDISKMFHDRAAKQVGNDPRVSSESCKQRWGITFLGSAHAEVLQTQEQSSSLPSRDRSYAGDPEPQVTSYFLTGVLLVVVLGFLLLSSLFVWFVFFFLWNIRIPTLYLFPCLFSNDASKKEWRYQLVFFSSNNIFLVKLHKQFISD